MMGGGYKRKPLNIPVTYSSGGYGVSIKKKDIKTISLEEYLRQKNDK